MLEEVKSPIDLRRPDDALQWANEANIKRPWRYSIFDYYADEILQQAAYGQILEIGAGPGYLAKHLLQRCPHIQYTAFDFSDAMHTLSRNKLDTEELARSQFITGDFKQPEWERLIAGQSAQRGFDVIIIHQALHELRHKVHAPLFHQAVKKLMHENSLYFVCDHIFAAGAMQNNDLYMSIDEHLDALHQANFKKIQFIRELKGLAVFKVKE